VEIKEFCEKEWEESIEDDKDGKDPMGVVYVCLKDAYIYNEQDFTPSCAEHIRFVIREENMNPKLNPQITEHCLEAIDGLCRDRANIVECLKEQYYANKLQDYEDMCMVEVARLLAQNREDIHADPVLEEACANDLIRYCRAVSHGSGRKILCLLTVLQHSPSEVDQHCKTQLGIRQKMWEAASERNVKDFPGLARHVYSDSNLLTAVTLLGLMILIVGTICGRVTKRSVYERKDR
jgi:Golgi apparatus protein 1